MVMLPPLAEGINPSPNRCSHLENRSYLHPAALYVQGGEAYAQRSALLRKSRSAKAMAA